MKGIPYLEKQVYDILLNGDNNYMILGDLNSRCGEQSECIMTDGNVPELEDHSDFFTCPVDVNRPSCDKTTNTSGLKLLQFCEKYSLYILNGRMGTDKGIGNYTYVSTVG